MDIQNQCARFMVLVFLISPVLGAQSSPAGQNSVTKQKLPSRTASESNGGQTPQTTGNAAVPSLPKAASGSGYMPPGEVRKLLDQVRFAEYRINDLLTDVHPERWKMSETGRASFQDSLSTLRAEMDSLKEWRNLFQARPDSSYFAFETYAAMNAALPRLEGVARNISEFENANYGVQFSQSGDRLFDLQQKLGEYVDFLLQNQDQTELALENNLAGCQTQLGQAMRGRTGRAKPMRNSPAVRPSRKSRLRG